MDNTQDLQIQLQVTDQHALISLIPPNGSLKRTPADICCVIDTSGSMSSNATVQSEKGNSESTGLSVLDVVKHSVNTIISTLDAGDRLALVQFSSNGRVVFELAAMDDKGKEAAKKALEDLHPTGSTNLWDGLIQGLDHMHGKARKNAHLLLLTDGEPTNHPPGGYRPSFIQKKTQQPLSCCVSTFGFGYVLDSPLLCDLATLGDGKYFFIPDSGLVGTVFVNCLSNILSTYATGIEIKINIGDTKLNTPEGKLSGFEFQTTNGVVSLNLGSMNYGQTRTIVLDLASKLDTSKFSATVKYSPVDRDGIVELKSSGVATVDEEKILIQAARVKLINVITQIMKKDTKLDHAQKLVNDLIAELQKLNLADTYFGDLVKDAEGQIYEAISKPDYWTKWGRHYLPSLCYAHLFEQCNNFKDPGVQHYGGDLFFELRDQIDEIFLKLPPPTPSNTYSGSYSYGSSSSAPSAPVNMNAYYNAYGG
jgi:hypothetical protein